VQSSLPSEVDHIDIAVFDARLIIESELARLRPIYPRVMSSFGKDSLAVIDLAAQFNIRDVLYIQDLDEVYDEEYIQWVIGHYSLSVTRCALGRAIFLPFKDQPLFMSFPFVNQRAVTPIPTTMRRWEGTGRYVCLDDELRTTRGIVSPVDTDFLIIGFKLSDVEKATCPVPHDKLPLEARNARRNTIAKKGPCFELAPGVPAVAPLFWWSDDEVWDYLERHGLPVSARTYDGHTKREPSARWCTRCHDPHASSLMWCPKVQTEILNTAALTNPLPSAIHALQMMKILTEDEAFQLLEQEEHHG
jgi:hypothetical protein